MNTVTRLTRREQAQVRAHLWALRTRLTLARDALMHFKADRPDRDRLEPAARRVDDLLNLYAGDLREARQAPLWIAEVARSVGEVTNSKVGDTLRDARAEIAALLEVMGLPGSGTPVSG